MIKFIADVNVEKGIVDFLLQNGYDVKWIPDYDCEITDDQLLKIAKKENRILITNDKDFGELVFLQKKHSAGLILIRVKEQKTSIKLKLFKKLLMNYSEKILNHFVVITETKFRFISTGDIK
jgi:predicted nuclease of predicted toxin-antitoxin system